MIDIFAWPLGKLLKFVYDIMVTVGLDLPRLSAYSLAIIITTIIFKLLLLPLTLKQTKSMKNMQEIQPKIKELNTKYKNDPQTLNQKTMELYKEHKVNPFGGCFPLLIQFPIIIAYFRVMQTAVPYVFSDAAAYDSILRGFLWIKDIAQPEVIYTLNLGGFNITISILAILAAITTYFSSKMMAATQPSTEGGQAKSTQATMTIMMPLLILWMGSKYAAGLTLYWTISNLFQMAQQHFTNRSVGKVKEELR
ncbi:MAG: YidC/Oxa1 family membrane protein insertase [Tissierellales bacterium]